MTTNPIHVNYNPLVNTDEQASIGSAPFCERRCKTLYLAAQTVMHLFLMLGNSIAKVCSYPFSKYRDYFAQKVSYHDQNFNNKPATYYSYGNQVVDFSVNVSPRTVELSSKGKTEKEVLIKLFGQKAKDILSATPIVPDVEDANSFFRGNPKQQSDEYVFIENRMILKANGNCLGASLDFIFQYLSQLKTGKTPMEAVHTIAPRYANGTPDDAWFIQILQYAIYPKLRMEMNEQAEKLSKEIESGCYTEESLQRAKDLLVYTLFCKSKEHLAKIARLQQAGSQVEIKLSSELEQLSKLPDHAYEVSIVPEKKNPTGHSIVFIKASGHFFLFDSNSGTLFLNKSQLVNALRDCSEDYLKGCESIFIFTPYMLADSPQTPSAQS